MFGAILVWIVVALLAIAGYVSSYFYKSALMFHLCGILLALMTLPHITRKFYLIVVYIIAIYTMDTWYTAIYNVSFIYKHLA